MDTVMTCFQLDDSSRTREMSSKVVTCVLSWRSHFTDRQVLQITVHNMQYQYRRLGVSYFIFQMWQ